jgi:CHAD domain-containing protein
LTPLVRRVRRLARAVGDVRDRDVTLALIEREAPSPGRSAKGSEELRRFLGRLRDDASTGRELLRASLTTARRDGLFRDLRLALSVPLRGNAARELERLVRDGWKDHRRKTTKAHRRARQRPSAGRLHRLRIRLRRWRQFATLAEISRAELPERLGGGWGALQDRLGEVHDLDVAIALLPEALSRSPLGARLARALREKRSSAVVALERNRSLARKRERRPSGASRGG